MKLSCLLLLTLLTPLSAPAANFSYDYLDLGHARITSDTGPDGSGPLADLSYSILDGVQFRAQYTRLDFAGTPYDSKRSDYSLGVTGETALNGATDLYTDLLYLNHHLTSTPATAASTDDGYRVAIGLRHRAWTRVELDGYLAHNYLAAGSNEIGVGAQFDITDWLAIGGRYAHDSLHDDTTTLYLRLSF